MPDLWAPVVGGDSCQLRQLAAEKLQSVDSAGYLLCGFGDCKTDAAFAALVEATLSHLDRKKPKLMTGIVRSDHQTNINDRCFPLAVSEQNAHCFNSGRRSL